MQQGNSMEQAAGDALTTAIERLGARGPSPSTEHWARRRDIVLTIVGWVLVIAGVIWAISHIAHALLVLVVAALLAYALMPVVEFLARRMPRWLALLLVYVAFFSVIGALGYLVVSTAVAQVASLSTQVTSLLAALKSGANSPLLSRLQSFGISRAQIQSFGNQLLAQTRAVVSGVVPLLAGVFNIILDMILVTVLSVYLLIDGHRIGEMVRTGLPMRQRERVTFGMNTLQRIVGGYIRGQLILATLIGSLVGIGMTILHVPYAVLLGVLAFLFEFIPIIGVFVSGAACVLIALTQGVFLALLVLVYFVVMHIIEGDVVGPRIVGRAVGVHPAVSIFALLAGAELFGIWGALFASPIAGLIQAVLSELFQEWRDLNAHQFPERLAMAAAAQSGATSASQDAPTIVREERGAQSAACGAAASAATVADAARPSARPSVRPSYLVSRNSEDSGATTAMDPLPEHPLPTP